MNIDIHGYRYELSEWTGLEEFPYFLEPERLTVAANTKTAGAVTICARGPYTEHDDPEGIAFDILPAQARLLAAALLEGANEAETS